MGIEAFYKLLLSSDAESCPCRWRRRPTAAGDPHRRFPFGHPGRIRHRSGACGMFWGKHDRPRRQGRGAVQEKNRIKDPRLREFTAAYLPLDVYRAGGAIFGVKSGTSPLRPAISKSLLMDSSPAAPMFTVMSFTYMRTNSAIRSLSRPLPYRME